MASPPPDIGPDGLARENPIIAYTERKIEAEQLQLKRYIQENYSKIREVERELENLNLELKLTAGPKKAALEHLRKKIELATERIRVAKVKEEEAKKVWEAAAQVVKDEEEMKKRLCDDLNQLVQESTSTQITRLDELKRRLECLNPARASAEHSADNIIMETKPATPNEASQQAVKGAESSSGPTNGTVEPTANAQNQQKTAEAREKKRVSNIGRGRGINNIVPKGRGSGQGWTGAGFDVDGRT